MSTVSLWLLPAACDKPVGAHSVSVQDQGGPELIAVDSLTLYESDTAFVGRPRDLAIDTSDGTFYVADQLSDRILHFARSGVLIRDIGRRGSGPGEISGIGSLLIAADRLYVPNWRNARIEAFDKRTGHVAGSVHFDGYITSIAATGSIAWLGNVNASEHTGVTEWHVGSDSFRHLVPTPAEYVRSPSIGGTFPAVVVVPQGESLLVGFMPMPYLLVASKTGAAIDTIEIPRRTRRTAPSDLVQAFARERDPAARMKLVSALFYAHQLSSGEMLLIHFDLEMAATAMGSRVYASILSADLQRACVDARIPTSEESRPVVAFNGDTVFVLEQRSVADSASSVVRAFLFSSARCKWESTRQRAGTSSARRH